ncbi:MAG: hypothetical protein K0Q94_3483 [Paenibacillus sp.]|jgi:hypothetical protein|uniref:hypothetical protein n=1 Tax=unclassified Paenibacillus TaxID=185978 RepID=UPI0029F22D53|nr:hypothetical protein [Paenibacillus sp.]
MQMNGLQPLTAKELEYVADTMSNEDLLIKLCAATASTTNNPQVRNICLDMLHTHEQHYHTLLNSLQHHMNLAPQQPGTSQ